MGIQWFVVAAAAAKLKNCFKLAKNSAGCRLWACRYLYARVSCVSKLIWIWSDLKSEFFFFGEKLTKFDLDLKDVIKNCWKLVKGLSVVILSKWQKNFFRVKSPTPLDSIFLDTKKNHFDLLLGKTRVERKSCSNLNIGYLVPTADIILSPSPFFSRVRPSNDFFVFSIPRTYTPKEKWLMWVD